MRSGRIRTEEQSKQSAREGDAEGSGRWDGMGGGKRRWKEGERMSREEVKEGREDGGVEREREGGEKGMGVFGRDLKLE